MPALKLTGSLDNYKRCEDNIPRNDGCKLDVSMKSSLELEVIEGNPQRFDLNKEAGDVDPNSEGRVLTGGLPQELVLDHSAPAPAPLPDLHFQTSDPALPLGGKPLNEQNGINPEPSRAENPSNYSSVDVNFVSSRHSNGFAHSDSATLLGDGPCSTGDDLGGVNPSSSQEAHNQQNGLTMKTGIQSQDGAERKLCGAESSSTLFDKKHDTTRKLFEYLEMDTCQCKGKQDRPVMLMECSCHSRSKKSVTARANSSLNTQHGLDLKFIYRDGVLSPVDSGKNVSF
ncbi:hypothetical protein LOK49_LG07G00564 [Camellia lanceoleosa]|uniref:Uncharacterized protein n=1 Tax=Camellia lanceoleosa TaxID=1840588 RepID=A0ACC0H1Y4_9ERIC|nr:hypothetical protein LOK49_LG07G00564 [Camellia lanceoleosa]